MDTRKLLPDECIRILNALKKADHEDMGSLSVHTGTHPVIGEIVIVCSSSKDAVLVHRIADPFHE